MEFPTRKEVVEVLRHYKRQWNGELEVRLQVTEDGNWCLWTGDPQCDTDHTGYWSSGTLDRSTNCWDLAEELLEEVKEDEAQSR